MFRRLFPFPSIALLKAICWKGIGKASSTSSFIFFIELLLVVFIVVSNDSEVDVFIYKGLIFVVDDVSVVFVVLLLVMVAVFVVVGVGVVVLVVVVVAVVVVVVVAVLAIVVVVVDELEFAKTYFIMLCFENIFIIL